MEAVASIVRYCLESFSERQMPWFQGHHRFMGQKICRSKQFPLCGAAQEILASP